MRHSAASVLESGERASRGAFNSGMYSIVTHTAPTSPLISASTAPASKGTLRSEPFGVHSLSVDTPSKVDGKWPMHSALAAGERAC